ncbi:metal ABC transporter ATP-binding protein [Spiractinospora alimapuensis]|nr:metal ABC transporter ATP-binding protein [Spiractinospora alimapuensis]
MVGVGAAYGRRVVLSDITLEIPGARITTLVGANGSGKSTLLGVLGGVGPTVTGEVCRHHRHRPALVVQRSAVPDALPVTVREVVTMGRWAHRGSWRRITAPDRAIVAESMEALGIAHLSRRPLASLSGGQRQRVLLAQGLAQRSDLLLLDEPETGLDSDTRHRLADVVSGLRARGITIVHATHDPATPADQQIHLAHGNATVVSAV